MYDPLHDKALDSAQNMKQSLERFSKDEIIDRLIQVAGEDRLFRRKIEWKFGVFSTVADLMESTRQAISEATRFDEKEWNSNFEWDTDAYWIIKDYLVRLLELGAFEEVMALSLEIMQRGSQQVEASDEGMMIQDIRGCLQVALNGLRTSRISVSSLIRFCDQLSSRDRIGCICDEEIQELKAWLEHGLAQEE